MASNFASSTILKGSDLINDFSCTSCKADDCNNEAQHFCEDCKKYFCDNCLTYHAKILRDHTVYGRQDISKWGGNSETCGAHGREVQAFCEDHQELCCSNCVDFNHRPCKKIRHILEVARDIHDTPEYKQLSDVLRSVQEKLDTLKYHKENSKQSVQKDGYEIREEIKSIRGEINTLLDDIERTTIKQLDAIIHDIITELDADIKTCGQTHDMLTLFSETMQSEKREKSSFIQYHKCQHEVKRAEGTIHEMCYSKADKHLIFESDNNLRKMISEVKMFGQIKENEYNIIYPHFPASIHIKDKSKENTRSCRENVTKVN